MPKEAWGWAMRGFPASNSHPARILQRNAFLSSPALGFISYDESDNSWGAERMEARNGGKSPNRTSRVKLLPLIFVFLTLAIIILSVFLHRLPLNDVEVTVDSTYRLSYPDINKSYIGFTVSVTNKGSIPHYVYLTAKVVFSSQPDMVFTGITRSTGPIDPGATYHQIWLNVLVPNELFQTPYEASCSVTLPPLVNEYSTPWILLPGVVWLVALAAVLTSLVRSWRQTR